MKKENIIIYGLLLVVMSLIYVWCKSTCVRFSEEEINAIVEYDEAKCALNE